MSQGSAQAQDEDQHWLENCLPLVQESQPMFADSEDAFDVNSTEQDLRQSDANKLRELDGVRDRLRALSRQAEAYKLAAQRPTNAPSEKQHEARLADLEAKKYGLVKTIADLDGAISSEGIQLSSNKESTSKAEKEDIVSGSDAGLPEVLKLQLFRSMGILPVEENAAYSRLLISSEKQASALALNGALSNYEYTEKAWSLFA